MLRKASGWVDSLIVVGLLAAGAVMLALAVRRDPHALQMLPGLDGCLTAGIVGLLLALLEGLPFRRSLAILAPVVALQVIACRAASTSPLPVLGIELLAYGALGALITGRSRQQAQAASREAPSERALPAR